MINRRQFLKVAGAGAAGFLTGNVSCLADVVGPEAALIPVKKFVPDLDIELRATPAEVPLLPGRRTGVLILRKNLARTLRQGHPWVYRDALAEPARCKAPAQPSCSTTGTLP